MSLREQIRRHPLIAYVVLAYLLSWSYWIPLALKGAVVEPGGSVTHLPGLLGPALAALLVPLLAGDRKGLADLLRRLPHVSRPVWRFWLVSLSPLLFLGLALLVATLTSASVPPLSDFARYSGLPALALWAVVPIVFAVNGLGEETGWRGFALPRLQERFGPLRGTLLLAVIWAAWHAPMFRVVETYRLMTPAMLVFGFGLGIVAGTLVLAHVTHETGGSVLAAALWHVSYNMTTATAAGRGIVAAVATSCVMSWAVLVLVLELWRGRERSLLVVPGPSGWGADGSATER